MASLKAMARAAETKKKSATPKKAVKKAPPPPTTFKSTEFVQSSEDEGDDSDKDSNSDNASSAANSVKPVSKANGKLPAPTESSSSSSEEDSESGSSAESSEEDDEPSNTAIELVPVIKPTKQSVKDPATRTVSFKESSPYKPPAGFELASLDGNSTVSQLLKKSNLEGKQIWYFTAPASVPIATIKQMSLQDVKKGKPILEHNGNNYGFTQDSTEDKTYTKIMVPNSSDDAYRTVSKPIDRILHLQRIVKVPGAPNFNKGGASKATIPAKKPIRQQPPGLKMRFRPIGFGDGNSDGDTGKIGSSSSSVTSSDEQSSTDSSSDVEMDDAP